MKYILTVLLSVALFSCNESPLLHELSDENFAIQKLENTESEPWSSGNYFTTNEVVVPPSSLDEVKKMLTSLKNDGVKFEKAWFNEGASSCGMLAVVVPSQTVIEVDESSFNAVSPVALKKFNELFKQTNDETYFWCPVNVYKITSR